MTKKLQNQLFIAVSTVLALLFVYYLWNNIDKDKTIDAFLSAKYLYLIISMALGVVSYEFRARRWNILFEPMNIRVKNASAFWTIAFSYFMNLTIPRSGEIARATSLYGIEGVPVSKSLGTIVVERLVDFLFLGAFGILTLVFCPKPFFEFLDLAKQNQSSGATTGIPWYFWVGIALAVIALVIYLFRNKIRSSGIYQKMLNVIQGFKEGLLSILKIKHKLAFALYSFGIWLCYYLMTYLVIFSFEVTEDIPWNYGFFLMTAGSLGMIFPASGGLAYPLVMRFAFGAIFVSLGKPLEDGYDAGSYFGISLYLAQIVTVIIFGLIALWYMAQHKIKKVNSAQS